MSKTSAPPDSTMTTSILPEVSSGYQSQTKSANPNKGRPRNHNKDIIAKHLMSKKDVFLDIFRLVDDFPYEISEEDLNLILPRKPLEDPAGFFHEYELKNLGQKQKARMSFLDLKCPMEHLIRIAKFRSFIWQLWMINMSKECFLPMYMISSS